MSRLVEKILVLIADGLAVNLTFLLLVIGLDVGNALGGHWFATIPVHLTGLVTAGLSIYWLIVYALFGLYGSWYSHPRMDEFFRVLKASFSGMIILAIVVLNLRGNFILSVLSLALYWFFLFMFTCVGRLAVRDLQRHLLLMGIGRRNTLIVGGGSTGADLLQRLRRRPELGYEVLGYVDRQQEASRADVNGVPYLGTYGHIHQLVKERALSDIIIAVESESHQEILDIIDNCNGLPVNLKIVPDLYDIASGHIKTHEITGFPLVDLLPEALSPFQRQIKRAMDITISLAVILLFWPVWVLIAMLIRLDSKGPIFFSQERVGKDGQIFTMVKFRSMVRDAEKRTGPVWADKDDFRITRVGRAIRKFRLDEVPQFINILKGEMSLVGPRPERPYFVEQLKHHIPLYTKRLKVRPGLTGWAQTRHKYDTSLDDVREKMKYDLYYLRNMSLMLDLKIILETVAVMVKGKGYH